MLRKFNTAGVTGAMSFTAILGCLALTLVLGAASTMPRQQPRPAKWRLIETPTLYPPVSSVVVSYDGAIWLRREPNESVWTWDVVSPSGDLVAFVTTRKNTGLIAADRETVWFVERDSLDVPVLVRYRTARAGG
jgi:hypothetical protein